LNRDAILRAADWLEANPDKHITGDLATTDLGTPVSPTSSRATCFCALGRIAKEAGVHVIPRISGYEPIQKAAGLTFDQSSDIWSMNDTASSKTTVITYLRKLAA
jgi:hypothetical protein